MDFELTLDRSTQSYAAFLYFFWEKEDQLESIYLKKSDFIQKSEKADLLSSNKNAV